MDKARGFKISGESFTDVFAHFLDSEQYPLVVRQNVASAKKRFDENLEKDHKRKLKKTADEGSQESQSQSQDSQISSNFSQDSVLREMCLGQSLLNEINEANHPKTEQLEEPLFDGEPGFNWHQYAVQCLGSTWIDGVKTWLIDINDEVEQETMNRYGRYDLPNIDLLRANAYRG